MGTLRTNAFIRGGSILGLVLLIGLSSGCSGKTEQAAAKVSPAAFKADPSKMTAADKSNMEKLMKGSGSPPPGTPATATKP